MTISITFFISLIAVVSFVYMPLWAKILIGVGGFVQLITAALISFRIEQKAGYYECQHCHHKYIPTYAQSNLAMHIGRKKIYEMP